MRTNRVPLCDLCHEPLGDDSVPYQPHDSPLDSYIDKIMTWVHRECAPA